jgi:S1-C subfamily serine protease
MRRVAGLLVAAGVVLALAGCVAPPEVTMRVRNRSCDGVATGSGFAVGPRRLVTNRHVVEGAEELQLDTWDGRSVSVAVHRVAYLHDLALIETLEPLPRVARLAADDPGPGARVTAVGFPLAQTRGKVIDRVAGVLSESGKVLRVSTAVTHGNSGGPCSTTPARSSG